MRAAFDVHGIPASQGSVKARSHGGRTWVAPDNPPKLKGWREAVRGEAQDQVEAGVRFAAGVPLLVTLAFRVPAPASLPKRRRSWPVKKKDDLDKLTRSTFDALTASGLIGDDGQIIDLHASKDYPRRGEVPGCRIVVDVDGEWELEQDRLNARGAS